MNIKASDICRITKKEKLRPWRMILVDLVYKLLGPRDVGLFMFKPLDAADSPRRFYFT
jgi:hypothetical protein